MLVPKPEVYLECVRCRVQVDPRVSRYLYVNHGWRGRCLSAGLNEDVRRGPRTEQAILCGPCGDDLIDRLREFLLGSGLGGRHAPSLRRLLG